MKNQGEVEHVLYTTDSEKMELAAIMKGRRDAVQEIIYSIEKLQHEERQLTQDLARLEIEVNKAKKELKSRNNNIASLQGEALKIIMRGGK